MRRLDSLETPKRGVPGGLGRQTKVSAEANLASGKHVENSVPYGTHLAVICWVLEDTGLDGEFARLEPLSARHS
jgi:hypothetical protein